MSKELVRNEWSVICALDEPGGAIELRWLASSKEMTDGGMMATLCLLALEAEKARPRGVIVDAVDFHHEFGPTLMAWRDAHVVPRYGAAGIRRFAFVMPQTFQAVGMERAEDPAVFTTRWFVDRGEAIRWVSTA